MNSKPRILIICTGNSMRSQIGEAMLRAELGDTIDVFSAGTRPGTVHPLTIASLEAAGIDTGSLRSKSVNEFLNTPIDLVITVCDSAAESCPTLAGAKKVVHRGYPDPVFYAGPRDPLTVMNELRDQIRAELPELVKRELDLD